MKNEPSIWKRELSLDAINQRGKGTLTEHLGIHFNAMGSDYLSAIMPIDQRTIQPMGILHGGATCALAETVGSVAANLCIDLQNHLCVGLDINVNHIRSVKSGMITAIAKPLHLGKTTQVWEIKIYNEEKKLIAASRLTMAVLSKKNPSLADSGFIV
jgi:1,4-dihydroxy-2-naphthoyl-CoA hydrolase